MARTKKPTRMKKLLGSREKSTEEMMVDLLMNMAMGPKPKKIHKHKGKRNGIHR